MYLIKYHGFILNTLGRYRPNSDLQLKLKKCSKPLGLPVCTVNTTQGTKEPSACTTSCIRFQNVFMSHITTAFMLLTTAEEEASFWVGG